MRKINGILTFFLLAVLTAGCSEYAENASPEYKQEIDEWAALREANLKKEEGWLNLAGLFWLNPGANTFGSGSGNDIVFPEGAPGFMGTFYLSDSAVSAAFAGGAGVMLNGAEEDSAVLKTDMSASPDIMQQGRYRWTIIQRGSRYGVRLRDLEADLVKNFPGIERFPVNEDWRIKAEYVPYIPPKIIAVPNVLGSFEPEIAPGFLKFSIDDKEFTLDAIASGDKLFILFADETSGEETYGAGRFLYADKPDSNKVVILDFNKAYNPPCAFTKYATCPLPPAQNNIRARITAGEMGVEH